MVVGLPFFRDDIALGVSLASVGGVAFLSYLSGRAILTFGKSK